MKKYLLHIVLFLCFMQQFHTQEDGVVSFVLPVRNTLKFNKYIINPTFSFVREQNRYISFNNKRQWVQFENAPQTFLFGYSGRFRENMGIGIGLFQQTYGVLTTFGGVLNFAYNVVLDRDSNLTFGMNLGFYKSGLNEGKIVGNFSDPSLENIPSNSILTVNPGINYGTDFLDFGLSINNAVLYNIKTSKIVEDDPEQSIQAHVMYTGYANTRGFFDESKFSGLIRSEFKKEKTVLSGIAMLTVPKGIWAQVGYNTLYGLSGGIGFNVSTQVSLEYNYEKAMGDLIDLGNSHDITLAYKFKNRYRYRYSGDDEEGSIIIPAKKKRRPIARQNAPSQPKVSAKERAEATARAKAEAEARAKAAELRAKERAEAAAKVKAEAEARVAAKAKAEEEARAKAAADAAAAKAKAEEEARLKTTDDAAAKAKAEEEARAKAAADAAAAKAKAEEEARAKAAADAAAAKAKAEEEARVKAAADAAAAKAKAEEEARAKAAADAAAAKAKAEEEARAKAAADAAVAKAKAKAEEEARVKAAADAAAAKAKAEEEARAKAAADAAAAKAKAEEEARAKAAADAAAAKAKAEEEARAKAAADAAAAKAKAEEEARAKAAADAAAAKAKAEEEARAKAAAKAKAEEEARAKAAADAAAAKARAEEEARAKAAADAAAAKAKAEEEARAKAAADAAAAKAKAEEEARAKAAADAAAAKAKAEEEARAKAEETVPTPVDDITKSMNDLLTRLDETVATRDQDLKDLKEENDLGEKGIFKAPKPFKSITAENAALESLKLELDNVITSRDEKIKALEESYKGSINPAELKTLERLKSEQLEALSSRKSLMSTLEKIKIATEIERKRRIKRAAYDNADDRYSKDMAALNRIKKNTPASRVTLTEEDFDFGEKQSGNIQIVKDVKNVASGYYLVIAVHNNVDKRDEFVKKAVSAGETDINFFYDENTSKYFIYYEKFDSVEQATRALQNKKKKPYNGKMSMVKIEN